MKIELDDLTIKVRGISNSNKHLESRIADQQKNIKLLHDSDHVNKCSTNADPVTSTIPNLKQSPNNPNIKLKSVTTLLSQKLATNHTLSAVNTAYTTAH